MPALPQTFIDGLGPLENARDVEAVAGLFAEHAKISDLLVLYEGGEPQAVKTFWSQYRGSLQCQRGQQPSKGAALAVPTPIIPVIPVLVTGIQ